MKKLPSIILFVIFLFTTIDSRADIESKYIITSNESCKYWSFPPTGSVPLADLIDQGLCQGEINGMFTALAKMNVICPPTDGNPRSVPGIIAEFLRKHPDYGNGKTVGSISFDLIKLLVPCNN